MANRSGEQIPLKIDALVYGGSGLARLPDGRAVFIPYVLPREEIVVQITEQQEHFARGQLLELLTQSPERTQPRCRHFTQCGGCHYQHIHYKNQLKFKNEIFIEQLQRIGGFIQPNISAPVPSPQEWHYRNTMQFHLTNEGKLGLMLTNSNDVFPLQECHLPIECIDALWPKIEFDVSTDVNRIEVRQGAEDDVMVVLFSDKEVIPECEIDAPVSVVHKTDIGSVVIAGEDYVYMKVGERRFRLTAGSFFQVNNFITEKCIQLLLEKISPQKSAVVLDLYCGVGLFSAFLAPLVKNVIAIESAQEAVDDFIENLDDFDNVSLYHGLVENILPNVDKKVDIVILDPPRAGLHRKALDALLQTSPTCIAYFSCDPATLARDAKRLCRSGFILEESMILDMFPQTYHIESLNIFRKSEPKTLN